MRYVKWMITPCFPLLLLTGCKTTDMQGFSDSLNQIGTNLVKAAAAQNNKNKKKNTNGQNMSLADTLTGMTLLPEEEARALLDKNYQIVSNEEFSTLDRSQRQSRLQTDIETLGFGIIDITPTFNKVQHTAMVYTKQQFELVDTYSTIAANHRDVQSFLKANEGKSKEELAKAIKAFDKTAKNNSQKIGPKLKAYEAANQKVFNANAELTAVIALQVIEIGSVLTRNPDKFLQAEGLSLLANFYKLEKASSILMDRLTLAQHANSMIANDKAIIDITKQIQEKQNQRRK
ncbi:hypothetical protein [Catenovulum sediminis]|uniref:hypothetical protein n=1 Tax=Catenovulum sediminis TaxID=1740262 RepID=UPI00117C215B|nr:hypothetical protein [Catenovulum sediminis]